MKSCFRIERLFLIYMLGPTGCNDSFINRYAWHPKARWILLELEEALEGSYLSFALSRLIKRVFLYSL